MNDEPRAGTDAVTIKIPSKSAHQLMSKLIAILIIGGAIGYLLGWQAEQQIKTGQELTPSQHIENYQKTKDRLLRTPPPIFMNVMGFVMFAILFGMYELLSFAIGLMLGKIIKPEEPVNEDSSQW